MPKSPKVMTEQELINAAHHLAESREQFVKELKLSMEAFTAISDRLRTFSDYLDHRDKSLEQRMVLHNNVMEALESLVKLLSENTVTLNQNTDRLEQFLKKFETYFGTDTGLEYEN